MALAPKTDVATPVFRNVDLLDLIAGRIKSEHALSRQINVPLIIDSHAVRTEFAKQFLAAQVSILADFIFIRFAGIDVLQET